MIRAGINGACGRMGSRLVALVSQQDDMQLAAALEYAGHPALGRDVGAANGGPELGVELTAEPPDGLDVLIDFSTPDSTVARAAQCAAAGTALVSGTTGLTAQQKRALEEAAERIAVLTAPNMSLGVNLCFKIAPRMAAALGDGYDVEIVEFHHRFKKDAPSGTALKLAEEIARALGRDTHECLRHGRRGATGERTRTEIGMHAVRGGDVVGDHTVIFAAEGERIELVHRAGSRDTFCRGALAAARFIVGKAPGLYGMGDVLGLT